MDLVRGELVVAAVLAAAVALGIATSLAARSQPVARGGRGRALAPLVPWLGGLLVVLLLVRGSTAAAVTVGLATVLHAVVTRLVGVFGRLARRLGARR